MSICVWQSCYILITFGIYLLFDKLSFHNIYLKVHCSHILLELWLEFSCKISPRRKQIARECTHSHTWGECILMHLWLFVNKNFFYPMIRRVSKGMHKIMFFRSFLRVFLREKGNEDQARATTRRVEDRRTRLLQ